jgi:hypothetical protein
MHMLLLAGQHTSFSAAAAAAASVWCCAGQCSTAHSCVYLICTWEALVDCWPVLDGAASALSASAYMAAAAPAFVSLALALLRHPTADSDEKGLVVDTTGSLFCCLEFEVVQAMEARGAANQHQTMFGSTDAGSQMMRSQELPLLLAICSAVYAQHAYTHTIGKAGGFPAPKPAAATAADAGAAATVPKFHINLLRALQVTGIVKLPGSLTNSHVLSVMNTSCNSLQSLMVYTIHNTGEFRSSSSSSIAAAGTLLLRYRCL